MSQFKHLFNIDSIMKSKMILGDLHVESQKHLKKCQKKNIDTLYVSNLSVNDLPIE